MGKCAYYDSKEWVCNHPNNPAGLKTKSGTLRDRCNAHSERCQLNGGKPIGICSYYDSKQWVCNNPANPAGLGTKSGTERNKCYSHSEKCELNLNKVNNVTNICPYCKKKISTIAIKRGRCSECGKYL